MSKSHSLTYQHHHHPPCPVPDHEGYPNGNPTMVHSQPNLSNKRWADKGAARCPNIPHHDNHTIGIQNSSSLLNLFSCLTWESRASDQEMAQAMASMTSLRGASQAVLEGSLQLSGSNRLSVAGNTRVSVSRTGFTVRAQQQVSSETEAVVAQSSRRAVLGLVTAGLATGSFVKAVLADAVPIKVGPPPPPSGGLPGTKNSDEARDLEKPLKERFFIQPLTPAEAAARAKASAQEILGVKALIDKKAWPYVQNDLRLRAEYLRYDLNTVISSMPKDQKKTLKDLTGKLFQTLGNLDHAAKTKSSSEAEKYYAETVSTLNDVLAKIG